MYNKEKGGNVFTICFYKRRRNKMKAKRNVEKKVWGVFLAVALVVTTMMVSAPVIHAKPVGINNSGSNLIINTGSGLVYTINKKNGDMTSCKLNGIELCGSKPSHINSGLGSANVTYSTSPSGATVVITVVSGGTTHYYVSRYGENIIYMATHITEEPSIGCLRYIFRGNSKVLTNVPVESRTIGGSGLEGGPDVFSYSNGTTTSKYYGNEQAKDLTIKGATGHGVGVFMAYGNRESCVGGPFFRDIQFQSGGDTEIYNVMNHGIGATENFRMGLYGPYAYVFTNGSKPGIPDFSWMKSLNLKGWVSSRGGVAITGINGMDKNYSYTYGFANDQAQYWATAASNGFAKCMDMKPGTYTMTIYKGELAVHSTSVQVRANETTMLHTQNISNDPSSSTALWRIGNWDGTPLEFLNGRNISVMHPQDVRNANWGPVTYTIGRNWEGQFPAAQFRGANSPTTILFNLSSAQASASHTFQIGITTAYNNGRPSVTVNGHALAVKAASNQPKTRSLTVGTYRGNNTTYSWSIPASYLNSGNNTISITPISGNSDLSKFLSASYSYDCVELLD